MAKNRVYYLILLVLTSAAAAVMRHKVSVAMAAAVITAPIVSLILLTGAFFSIKHKYSTDLSSVERGRTVHMIFQARCGFLLSFAYIHLVDHNNQVRKIVCAAFGGKTQASYDVECPHIGIVNAGMKKMKLYDMFGLFCFRKSAEEVPVVVYPQLLKVDRLAFGSGTANEVVTGSHSFKKDDVLVSSIREYQQDDNMRSIHWKLSSKMNTLMVKNHENIAELGLTVIADVEEAGQCIDRIIECAVSAVKHSLDKNLPARLILGDSDIYISDSGDFRDLMGSTAVMNFDQAPKLTKCIAVFLKKNHTPCNILIVTSKTEEIYTDVVKNLVRLGYTVYSVAVSDKTQKVVKRSQTSLCIPDQGIYEIGF